eukprot:8097376-Pyramimonas_sp.AAC.1
MPTHFNGLHCAVSATGSAVIGLPGRCLLDSGIFLTLDAGPAKTSMARLSDYSIAHIALRSEAPANADGRCVPDVVFTGVRCMGCAR